jgi:hypothetical protein
LQLTSHYNYLQAFTNDQLQAQVMIAGAGWLTDSLQPFLFPSVNLSVGMITGFGELVFMFWLFINGVRLKEQN